MKQRKKVGVLFSYSEGWIGGTYYFINLVQALNSLPDEQKPEVVIVSDSQDSFEIMQKTNYPYLSYLSSSLSYSLVERTINKVGRSLLKKNLIVKGFSEDSLDILFGYYEQLDLYTCADKLYWIPDLQDKYYPAYVGEAIAEKRALQHQKIAYGSKKVVFSSADSRQDFEDFYPKSNSRHSVAHFAVTLPDISEVSYEQVAYKYGLPCTYFAAPNQFWSHKNHQVVIEAIHSLKKKGLEAKVIFTGNEKTGGGHYAQQLKDKVREYSLEQQCLFLGFIDRKEQLLIMQRSAAVIQPSLFEGWSTVVEDAKSLGKFVLLSDLKVHREQLQTNVAFFDPEQPTQLAVEMESYLQKSPPFIPLDYQKNIETFAKEFLLALN